MFIAGIWHGAGLPFIVFGLLHGCYLVINHGWRMFRKPPPFTAAGTTPAGARHTLRNIPSVLLTFLAVLSTQTFFRSNSCRQAVSLLAGLTGFHGIGGKVFPGETKIDMSLGVIELVIGFGIIWGLPNTQQILSRFKPALHPNTLDNTSMAPWMYWKPKIGWALAIACVFFFSIIHLEDKSTFLYFQF